MKKICNFIKNFIIFVYILLIIFVTICLLSYNDYKITVFGDTTLIPIIDENLEPDYTIGDLVIVEKNKLSKVQEGDIVFFYRIFSGEAIINYAKITETERVTDTQYTFSVDGDYRFSSDYYIGNTSSATIIPKVGSVLKVLQSKWGFLFLGVFPSLLGFLYTLYSIIAEVRYNDEEDEEEPKEKKSKAKKSDKEDDKKQVEKVEEIKEETKKENKIAEVKVKEEKTENKEESTKKPVEEKNDENSKKDKIEKTEVKENNTETKIEAEVKQENKTKNNGMTAEEKKKALVEAKLKTMTAEEKKALIEAKLKSMTPEEKKALIEAKKKKMEEQKK